MDHIENAPTIKKKLMETMKAHSTDDDPSVSEMYKTPAVLPADHPLLDKFQRALKAHLLKVNSELADEVKHIEEDIERMNRECNEIGAELYDQQEAVERQKNTLDDYNNQLKELSDKRAIHESNVLQKKKQYDEENRSYKEAKRVHNENLQELSHLQVLQSNMSKWTQEIEDEVLAAKRAVSKDGQNQRAISQQKKQMDLMLFNLDNEIRKVERQLANTNQQIDEQTCIMHGLNNSVSDANADVNALQNEHKRLIGSWNDVILSIKKRDKQLSTMREQLNDELQQIRVLDSSIDGTKKACDKEMEQNEKLEAFRLRLVSDHEMLKKQTEKEQNESDRLQHKVDKLKEIMEQTEADQRKADVEWHVNENQLKVLRRTIEKQLISKQQLEEKTLELLQNKISTDQASCSRSKVLRETQEKRRHMELALFNTEQQFSKAMLEMEEWKSLLAQDSENLRKLKKTRDLMKRDTQAREMEIFKIKSSIGIKYKAYDSMNAKLVQLIEAAGGSEVNPMQLKLVAMEKTNAELDVKIRESQGFWLRLQGHVVSLSQKRSEQFNSIQLAQKQLLVIAQKNLKVESQLAELKQQERDTQRTLKTLYTKVDQTNAQLFAKKKCHQSEEVECLMSHQALVDSLKDEEMAVLKLEKDLVDRSNDIEEAKIEALEKHREALSWETKWKMANETKEYRAKELEAAGEIGMMKAEIHRMEVRLLQLQRAQYKLAQDMENCVMHRDHIYDGASLRNKLPEKKLKSRFTVLHRLNDLKNKHKLAQNELSAIEREIENANGREESYQVEIRMLEEVAEQEKAQNEMLCTEIELATLRKQENLDKIVRVQSRTRQFRSLLTPSKGPPRIRSETKLNNDTVRQNEINDHLVSVMESLLVEFPDHMWSIKRTIQTLKPSSQE